MERQRSGDGSLFTTGGETGATQAQGKAPRQEPGVGADTASMVMACASTMLAVGTVFMNQSIFLELAKSFAIDIQDARYSFGIISLGYSLAFVVAGPVADLFEARKVAASGLAVLASLLLCASWLQGFSLFLVCMGALGVGAALVPASIFPYVARVSSDKRRGVYVGAIVASATLGIIVGRVCLGVATDWLGWRGAYRLFALVFLVFAFFLFGMLRGAGNGGHGGGKGLSALYGDMFRLLIRPATASLLLTGFCLFFGFLGAVTFLTYRLAAPPFNFTSGQVGYISFAGLVAVVAPFAGGLSQRFGVYRIVLPSLAVCLAALQILAWSRSVASMTLGILLLFLGVYACQPLLFLLMGRRISRQAMGVASSLYILCCIGGGSLASMVLGGVWRVHGWQGVVHACSASIAVALVIACIGAVKRSG